MLSLVFLVLFVLSECEYIYTAPTPFLLLAVRNIYS